MEKVATHQSEQERPFEHKVLEEISTRMSKEYVKMLGQLNTAIAKILKQVSDTTKSDGLVVVNGGLSKAYPLGGQAAGVDRPDVNVPGERGGKWWRDKHGHVRYGAKPGEAGGARDWQEVPEGDVQKLHESIEAAYEYSPELRDKLCETIQQLGFTPEQFLDVIHGAKSYGESTEKYFVDMAGMAGHDAEEAANAFSKIYGTFKDAMEDPDLQAAVQEAVHKRAIAEYALHTVLVDTKVYSTGFIKEFMTGDVGTVAMKLIALMTDIGMLYIPHGIREVGGNRAEAYEKLGRIIPNHQRLEIMRGLLNELSPEQLGALFVAERFHEIERSSDPVAASAIAFKDPDTGEYSTASVDERKNNIFFFLRSELEAEFGRRMSIPEYDKTIKRLNEVGHFVNEFIQAFNNDQGGEAVGLVVGGQFPSQQLFEEPESALRLEQMVVAKRTLIKDALAAQKNVDFATPSVMVPGFASLSDEMHRKGELDPNVDADLTDHQRQAVNWMLVIKQGILAYDTAMGKTPIVIACAAHLITNGFESRAIVVMPKGLVKQWPDQIKNFYPGAKVQQIRDNMSLNDRMELLEAIHRGDVPCDFLIMSSSTVGLSKESRNKLKQTGIVLEVQDPLTGKPKWQRRSGVTDDEYIAIMRQIASTDPLAQMLKQLGGAVFFDEAHHESQGLKEPTNVHNIVAREFLKDRKHVFLMSASPIPNGRPEELFNLMDLAHPGSAGPDVVRFANKVAHREPTIDEQTGAVTMELVANDNWEQVSKDIAPFVFFKKKTDPAVVAANKKAGLKIPGHVIKVHSLDTPKEIKDLFKMAGDIRPHYVMGHQWVPKDKLSLVGSTLRTIHQLQQLSISPKLILGDSYTGPQPKIEHAVRLVQQHFNDPANAEKPFIIASQWPSAFPYLKQALIEKNIDPSLIEVIDGNVPPDKRDVVQEAVNAGKVKVLLLGTQAGGAGLNLQKRANHMAFLDQPWSPHHKSQTIGRVDRPGRSDTEPINITDVKLVGSIDEDKLIGLRDKLSTIETLSYAKDGGEVAARAVMASVIDMMGGLDALEQKSRDEIETDLQHMGLTGLVTPEVLQTKFDIQKFFETVEYRNYLRFEEQDIESRRALNSARYKIGKITKEQYQRRDANIDKLEDRWKKTIALAGTAHVTVPKHESVKPERQFALLSDKLPTEGVIPSKTAQAIFAVMHANPGKITITDFMDGHLRPIMEMQAKNDEDHGQLAAHWWKHHDQLKRTVKDAFKELQRYGVIGVHHHSADAKMPSEAIKELPEGAKGAEESAPAEGPVVEAERVPVK